MKYNYQIVDKRGGSTMAMNDNVEVISTSNEELNGQQGTIVGMISGELGTEVKVLLDSGMETWIDAEDVFTL